MIVVNVFHPLATFLSVSSVSVYRVSVGHPIFAWLKYDSYQ